MLRYLVILVSATSAGCSLLPDIAHQPSIHNPFPQLSKVAIAPFFNLSTEPTVDGKRMALAYYAELQSVPGFEVVPINVVEQAIRDNGVELSTPTEARRLAQLLDVDAVVIGAVTDYTPYYPPQLGLQIEWYAANPCFHPIPPGYGLPWGTPGEQHIPGPLVFEAELALAKAQLATQTPPYDRVPTSPAPKSPAESEPRELPPADAAEDFGAKGGVEHLQYEGPSAVLESECPPEDVMGGMPPEWPDPRGLIPPPPSVQPPSCCPSDMPVMRHTEIFSGTDMELTEALSSYYFFKDDARMEGWQTYLQRSEDFIRFCCHMHISAMLSARGGAGQTRVVWRWPSIR